MTAAASALPLLTKEECLAQHPFPKEYAAAKRLEWFWHYDVDLSAKDLWTLVADSSRMNRALQVSEMKFEDRNGQRIGSSRPGGFFHEWQEVPWNWVAERFIESVRIYRSGFSKVVYAVFMLQPLSTEKTRLYVYFGAVPKNPLTSLALRLGFPSVGREYAKLLPRLADEVRERRPLSLVQPGPGLSEAAQQRLATIRQDLIAKGLDVRAVNQLLDWIANGDEQELFRIQVRERARAFQVDEDALLRVCLHATRLGLLELSWDVMCPHCRGVSKQNGSLGDISTQGACEVCLIDFGTDSSDAVEITFHVHPSIREVPLRTFCSAEPATKEHIRVQHSVPPDGKQILLPPLPKGRYRLRWQGHKRYGYLDVGVPSGAREIDWRTSSQPCEISVDSDFALRLHNDSSETALFVLETAQWSDLALRPGRIFSLQEFRDLFREEYLSADVQLAIGQQTILFTDMVGSTELYAKQGDAVAFREVRRHFADVFRIIAEHRGAVVKTIGDAVMGAFTSPLDAVLSAKAIHDCFHPGRSDSLTKLRISVNVGPCIAVKLNTDIDYFGHTVNVAAKLQSLAGAWQVALSDEVYFAPGVADWLAKEPAKLEAVRYESPSLLSPISGKRWTVYEGGP